LSIAFFLAAFGKGRSFAKVWSAADLDVQTPVIASFVCVRCRVISQSSVIRVRVVTVQGAIFFRDRLLSSSARIFHGRSASSVVGSQAGDHSSPLA
jgi:hypothetical protein